MCRIRVKRLGKVQNCLWNYNTANLAIFGGQANVGGIVFISADLECNLYFFNRAKHPAFIFSPKLEPGFEKTCLIPYANNKCSYQPAHPRSLVSAFVVRCLDSVIHLRNKSNLSRL